MTGRLARLPRISRQVLAAPLCAALVACAPVPPGDKAADPGTAERLELPAAKIFPATVPTPTRRSNRDIARDFLDLAFMLESGAKLERFSRFEKPITVRLDGKADTILRKDLNQLINLLKRQSFIDIRETTDSDAAIVIHSVPGREIRRIRPLAACFVVPGITELSQYRRAIRSGAADWTQLRNREKMAIFIPNDVSPQEARNCLHEELAQAIGPPNDLYRLPDSVFNDDDMHAVLTGFDLLVLRTFYSPRLQSGMTRGQVAAQLPDILRAMNPRGEETPPELAPPTPQAWVKSITQALGRGSSSRQRISGALYSVAIAQDSGWTDHRLGFSHIATGWVSQSVDPARALDAFRNAERLYRNRPDTRIHHAHAILRLAAFAIHHGDGEQALRLMEPHISTAREHQNAALLARFLMLKAEALELTGKPEQARETRLDSLGWARYGFGNEKDIRRELARAAALRSKSKQDE